MKSITKKKLKDKFKFPMKNCFIRCTLRTGAIIIGILYIVHGIFYFAGGIFFSVKFLIEEASVFVPISLGVFRSMMGLIIIGFGILIMLAAIMEMAILLFIWIGFPIAYTICCVSTDIVVTVGFYTTGFPILGTLFLLEAILIVCCNIYFIIIAMSLHALWTDFPPLGVYYKNIVKTSRKDKGNEGEQKATKEEED